MSDDFIHIIKELDMEDPETQMALQCAPFLAGLKLSNLYIIPNCHLKEAMDILVENGLEYVNLYSKGDKTTFLVYDKVKLKMYLTSPNVSRLLKRYGYTDFSLKGLLARFRINYRNYAKGLLGYPHEIGVFLGYPVDDVEAFIQNKGEHALYTGYWKVYNNLNGRLTVFSRYEKAMEKYVTLVHSGMKIRDIIGSAY